MIREKRLSPRRASKAPSRLPLSPRRTQGSPKTTPYPPAASADTRKTREARSLASAPITGALLFDARSGSARLAAGVRLCPTARLPRKSTVCGLSGLHPGSAGSPPIKSSTRLGIPRGSCTGASLRRVHRRTAFPVWKEKLQCTPIFLSNSGIERFLERIRVSRAWPNPPVADDGQL
jgi:hypothetical protein